MLIVYLVHYLLAPYPTRCLVMWKITTVAPLKGPYDNLALDKCRKWPKVANMYISYAKWSVTMLMELPMTNLSASAMIWSLHAAHARPLRRGSTNALNMVSISWFVLDEKLTLFAVDQTICLKLSGLYSREAESPRPRIEVVAPVAYVQPCIWCH